MASPHLTQAQIQQQTGGAVALATLLVRYERFRDAAGATSGSRAGSQQPVGAMLRSVVQETYLSGCR